MEAKIHLHNWYYFFREEKICWDGLKYNFGRVYGLEESLSGDLVSPSISHQLLSGWKKKIIMLWGFREGKKMDTSLHIVIYAGFRFNPGKYSKIHREKHSKLTSHYTSITICHFLQTSEAFCFQATKKREEKQIQISGQKCISPSLFHPTDTSRGNLSLRIYLLLFFVMLIL